MYALQGKPGWHKVMDNGTFAAFWHEDGHSVKILNADAKHWQYVLDGPMTLSEMSEILSMFDNDQIDVTDVRFLADIGQAVETILEHAHDDLVRYGEVGVTF